MHICAGARVQRVLGPCSYVGHLAVKKPNDTSWDCEVGCSWVWEPDLKRSIIGSYSKDQVEEHGSNKSIIGSYFKDRGGAGWIYESGRESSGVYCDIVYCDTRKC